MITTNSNLSLIAVLFLIFIFLSNVSFSQEIKKEYYNNGQFKSIGKQNLDGKRTREWKVYIAYYDNGQLHQIANFENGKLTGECKEFYENGQLKKIGNYENGLGTGESKTYNQNGAIIYGIQFYSGFYDLRVGLKFLRYFESSVNLPDESLKYA